jgi:hypothetical protein
MSAKYSANIKIANKLHIFFSLKYPYGKSKMDINFHYQQVYNNYKTI